MGSALGVVIATDITMAGQHAQPVYVDDSLPIVGPSRAVVVTTGEVPQLGGPPMAVRLAPAGTPATGPGMYVYVVPGGGSLGVDTFAYTNKVLALSPIAYWPLAETSGVTALDASGNGRNGTYRNSAGALVGVTLGNAGIGDGRTAAAFNGSTGYCNIYSVSLNGAFTGGENTVAFWARGANAGVWSDATNRQLWRLFVDANNFIRFIKGADNVLNATYVAGGVANNIGGGTPISDANWHHIAFTTSKGANQRKLFIDGVQVGATATVGGTWAGSLNSTECAIGAANTTPVEVWNGTMAHVAVWSSALTPTQIATLSTTST